MLVIALILLAPSVVAHVDNARPITQPTQSLRNVAMEADGVTVTVTLTAYGEPTRHWVRHVLDPARGEFHVEYRRDEASQEGRFTSRWTIDRIVEYRDLNVDGRFQPDTDTLAKSWRLDTYQWRIASPVTRVQVGGVTGSDVVWEATATAAPKLRLEAVAAGNDFTDEGAFTRPQDVLLYFDVLDMPPRSVGSLFAIEGSLTTAEGARAILVHVGEYSTAIWSASGVSHPMLVWGGEALLDGRESKVDATLGEPTRSLGHETRPFILHLPTVDRSMRFVIIDAIEFDVISKRTPIPAGLAIVAVCLGALLALRSKK